MDGCRASSSERDPVEVTPIGGLANDRAYAILDREGAYVNGKLTDAVHRVRASFDPDGRVVSLRAGGEAAVFDLAGNRAEMAAWLSSYFGMEVAVDEVMYRLRPNLVVEDVPAFREDRLVGSGTIASESAT